MIAEAIAAACADRGVLARIAGPLGEAARQAAAELARVAPGAQRARRAEWAAAARAPVAQGLRGVHPSWIEAGLAGLPARAREAVARGGGDPVDTWLARIACAEIPPLPAADLDGPPRSIDEATRLRPEALARWLAEVGADQLAFAVGAAARDPALIARLGDRLPRAVERIGRPPRLDALGPLRAAIARSRVPLDEHALVTIGARALAPHADPLSARRLAVRLPRPLGLALRDTLAGAADPGPSWQALAAAY